MSSKIIAFAVVLAVALALFGWSCYRRFRLVARGRPEDRFNNVGQRLQSMLVYAFGQRRVLNRRFGLNHFVIFWTFMVLLLANGEFLLNGLAPDFIGYSRLPEGAYRVLSFVFDVASALALVAVSVAIIRRAFFAPPHIGRLSRDAAVVLLMIAVLMLAFFGLSSTKIALGSADAPKFAPISSAVAYAFLSGASVEWLISLG